MSNNKGLATDRMGQVLSSPVANINKFLIEDVSQIAKKVAKCIESTSDKISKKQ